MGHIFVLFHITFVKFFLNVIIIARTGVSTPPEFFWWPDDKRCPLNFKIFEPPLDFWDPKSTTPPLLKGGGGRARMCVDMFFTGHFWLLAEFNRWKLVIFDRCLKIYLYFFLFVFDKKVQLSVYTILKMRNASNFLVMIYRFLKPVQKFCHCFFCFKSIS